MMRLFVGAAFLVLASPAAAQLVPEALPSDAVTRETALDYARHSGRHAGLLRVCGGPLHQPTLEATAMAEVADMDATVLDEARAAFGEGLRAMARTDCDRLPEVLQQIRDGMTAAQGRWFDHISAGAPTITVGRLD